MENFNDYFSRSLKLDVPAISINTNNPASYFSNSTSMTPISPSYNPSCLLDFNWNDGDHDVFMLNMFKKVLGDPYKIHRKENIDTSPSSIHGSDHWYLTVPPIPPKIQSSPVHVTECVTVPTSKHVAQILGKKGCKIRALRDSTCTYIRSPLPKEEPVFIVKGRKADVIQAVNAIRSASDFFTFLESEKESTQKAAISSSRGEVIVVKLSIPETVVGLVVGVQGATIKEIEKQTKTYIQSPTMNSDPVFTITGSPEHCEKAMNFISRYLTLRGVGPGIVKSFHDMDEAGKVSSSNSNCEYFYSWEKSEIEHH